MLLIVSIVSSCIDVACHVNMHFGVSAGKIKRHCFITYVSFVLSKISEIQLWQHMGHLKWMFFCSSSYR